jgi:biotin carboxyl carrier protein
MTTKIVTIQGQQTEVDPRERGIEIIATRADEMELRIDGKLHVVPYVVQGMTISFAFDAEAPMPGVVLKILVKQGDVVAKGAPLLILEAMKMEHQIVAPRDGKVAAINCVEGELVQPGVELVTMNDEG